jgi:hypothetical protein
MKVRFISSSRWCEARGTARGWVCLRLSSGEIAMTPLRELLARIRWDPGFRRGRYEVAYLDRRRMGLVRAA